MGSFKSEFTHAYGATRLTSFAGGLVPLRRWFAGNRRRFRVQYLTDARETLRQFVEPTERALRATFDGWTAKVGPAAAVARLPEREYCLLSGILAASLAISELFLDFAEVSIEAARRTLALFLSGDQTFQFPIPWRSAFRRSFFRATCGPWAWAIWEMRTYGP